MNNSHPLYKSLTGDLILFPEGTQTLEHNYGDWKLEITSKRTRRWAGIYITACNSKLQSDFEKYSIQRAKILSFVSRDDNFKSSGKLTEYSNLLLSSKYSRNLLNAKHPAIGLNKKCIWYKGKIRRRNDDQILTILILIEKLTTQFDQIIARNAT